MISTSFGFMIEKRRERGFIYRWEWGVMIAVLIVVDVSVEVVGGLVTDV